MKKIWLNIAFILLLATTSSAQQKYWIYFKDKKNTTMSAPDKDYYDIDVNQVYVDSLSKLSCTIIQRSKWLNAVTSKLSKEQQQAISHLGFVKKIKPVNQNLKVLSLHNGGFDMKIALKQVNADTLIKAGLFGKGVKIGIIDGGFLGAHEDERLLPIIKNKGYLGYRNFIEKDVRNPFTGTKKYGDDHGTAVWALTGGYDAGSNKYYGVATESQYYLARTDQGDKEYRGEEDHWIAALEWMHDQGVRLINSSLGYSNGYDNPKENYAPDDVDGQSAAITQAATIAAKKKNMILVISAGNDGGDLFEIISIPADADGILAVGATGYSAWGKQYYSSTGPDRLPYVKPEISCYSSNGTSFSAPIITGLIASILQVAPHLSSEEVSDLIKKSGHLYPYPNNYIGYGVPDAKKMLLLLSDKRIPDTASEVKASSNTIDLKLESKNVMLFHKKNERQVIHQEDGKCKRGTLTVTRYENAAITTVATPDKVFEIIWE